MNCRKVTHLLSAYLDGELPGVECLQIRDHLRQCEDCASEYEDLLSMKRLLGRLKIQEPAHDMSGVILQSIRIESDLMIERSPLYRFYQFADRFRSLLRASSTIGVCIGLACALGLFYSQSISGDHVHVIGEWDHSVPAASEFTAGANYPNAGRFIVRPAGGGTAYNGTMPVSFGQDLHENSQNAPFAINADYITTRR